MPRLLPFSRLLIAGAWLIIVLYTLLSDRTQGAAPSAETLASRDLNGPRLVVQELRGSSTLVWEMRPAQPEQRQVLATFSHREGYGPRLALSPDGQQLAATVLPSAAADPATQAQLWVHDLQTQRRQLIAEGVDLRGAPAWEPAGRALAVRRWSGDAPVAVVVSPDGAQPARSLGWPAALSLNVVGWDAEGRLLASVFASEGSDLVALDTATRIAHLSDGPARDFRLAPDRSRLSYLSEPGADGARLHIVSTAAGQAETAEAAGIVGAIWQAEGRGLLLSQTRSASGFQLASFALPVQALALPPSREPVAVDVPVAAGTGGYLAVRRLEGGDLSAPARETLWVLGPEGDRPVRGDGYLEAVGWRGQE